MALVVSVPFMCSCEENGAENVEPKLEVTTNPMGAERKTQFLRVQASGAWTITVDYPYDDHEEWVAVKPSEGEGSASVPGQPFPGTK